MAVKNYLSKPRIVGNRWLFSILILLIFAVLIPLVVRNPYKLTLLITVGTGAILAMTFVLLLKTGLVTLAIAAFWGVGAYVSTMMAIKLNQSFWMCLPASVIVTGALAFLLGIFLVRNSGFSFVIMTMILGMVFVVAVGSVNWLGGYSGVIQIPRPTPINLPFLPPIKFISNMAMYYLMIFLMLLVVVVFAAFYNSSIGRAWTVIGLNRQLAESLGINVFKYRLLAFVLSGATSGLVGSFYAHYVGSVRPDAFNLFKTVYVHIYAILGGIEFPLLGPIIGSLVMVLFPEYMRITHELESIITGGLLIVLIIFLPTGILSLPGLKVLVSDPAKVMATIKRRVLDFIGSSKRK